MFIVHCSLTTIIERAYEQEYQPDHHCSPSHIFIFIILLLKWASSYDIVRMCTWISGGYWPQQENLSREATMLPGMSGEPPLENWDQILLRLSVAMILTVCRTVAGRLDNTWKAFASGFTSFKPLLTLAPCCAIFLCHLWSVSQNLWSQVLKSVPQCLPCPPCSIRRLKAT